MLLVTFTSRVNGMPDDIVDGIVLKSDKVILPKFIVAVESIWTSTISVQSLNSSMLQDGALGFIPQNLTVIELVFQFQIQSFSVDTYVI